MARRTAAAQRAYRTRLRGKPPRPYRIKTLVEQVAYTIPIQYLINRAYRQSTAAWIESTPAGDMPIQIDSAFLRNDQHYRPPTWICMGGIRYELRRWDVLDEKFYRWGVVDQENGRVYTKIYILANGRFGTRLGLNLAHQSQNMSKEKRALRKRRKLIAKIRGEDTLGLDYIAAHPDYVPERRKNKKKGKSGLLMREGKYHRLRLRLANPNLKYYGKRQRAMRKRGGIVIGV